MRLQHVHLLRPVPYTVAGRIQEAVVRRHIDFGLARQRESRAPPPKQRENGSSPSSSLSSSSPSASLSSPSDPFPPSSLASPPDPFLLTFETTPTYTCGRREVAGITPDRVTFLRAGGRADFAAAPRGGQTTFHGPGQLTAYLVLSLRAHGLTPRCYVRFLEQCTIRLLAGLGVSAVTTDEPGVWLAERVARSFRDDFLAGEPGGGRDGQEGHQHQHQQHQHQQKDADHRSEGDDDGSEQCRLGQEPGQGPEGLLRATDSKICAVGVHMRRGITSHGLGLNVRPDLAWFERIVACGLAGKRVTSLEEIGVGGLGVREIAVLLAAEIASGLRGVEGVPSLVDLAGAAEPPRLSDPPPPGE